MIPVEMKNARLKLVLRIPTAAQIIVANNAMELLPVIINIMINDLSK